MALRLNLVHQSPDIPGDEVVKKKRRNIEHSVWLYMMKITLRKVLGEAANSPTSLQLLRESEVKNQKSAFSKGIPPTMQLPCSISPDLPAPES